MSSPNNRPSNLSGQLLEVPKSKMAFLRKIFRINLLGAVNSWLGLKVKVPLVDGSGYVVTKDAEVRMGSTGAVITLPPVALPGSGGGTGMGGVNYQTANYAAVSGDSGFLIAFNSGNGLTLTLPNPPPGPDWFIAVECIGAGGLIISRNGLNIDTAGANLALTQNQGLIIFTDGTNYFTMRGLGGTGGINCGVYDNTKAWNKGDMAYVFTTTTINGVTILPGIYQCQIAVAAGGTGNQIPQFPLPAGTQYWFFMTPAVSVFSTCVGGNTAQEYIAATGQF